MLSNYMRKVVPKEPALTQYLFDFQPNYCSNYDNSLNIKNCKYTIPFYMKVGKQKWIKKFSKLKHVMA